MIFWILLALTIIIPILIASAESYGFLDWLGMWFISTLAAGVLSAILMLITAWIGWSNFDDAYEKTSETTHTLRAVGTDEQTSGAFYILGGYISDQRVLNYIRTDNDGSNLLKSVPAEQSRIWEDVKDGEDPTVTIVNWEKNIWWIAPFSIDNVENYWFHIPEGSIVESTTIKN